MLKICENIINNLSQIERYGNLHAHARKINEKLNKCKPALNLLYIAGFEKSNNNTQLIWMNTNNNIQSLINIHQTLQSIMNTETTTSDTFDELINLGFTKEEASTAISISNHIDSSQYAKVFNEVSMQMVFCFLCAFSESF